MIKNLKKYAVIVAGGSGSRMKSDIPKQFIEIGGMPILMHTINNFKNADKNTEIIVVLPSAHISTWKKLCEDFHFEVPHQIKPGGTSRFKSVKNGIEGLDTESLVAIHDGVRPFTSVNTINNAYSVAYEKGNAIVVVPLKDSVREVTNAGAENIARDRSLYRLVQTPQTFLTSILKEAYNVEERDTFTDDASVVEFFGIKINLVEGSYRNIKITTPEDLLFAKILLDKSF